MCSFKSANGTFYCKKHLPKSSDTNIHRDTVMCKLTIPNLKFIIDNIKNLKVIGRYVKGEYGEFLELREEDKNLCKYLKLKYQE